MKKLLASLLLLCSAVSAEQTAGTTALDPTQVYTTGNIVLPTVAGTNQTPWVNGVYQDQLSCWAWGNPGNCGPNPTVRPGNLINYSFGYTDLYQIQAISSVLPTTGLRVNGYNFGFMAKNGNGWDDGRLDQLNAYVTFYGTDGKVKDYTNYDLNSQFNWTQFNYTKDFVTPYADKDLSTVRYGFTGKDNNFWAGTYGPEIYNVSFSLKYSVDPCATNVLSSPTCPGYSDALAKLLASTTPVVSDTTTTTTTVTTATSDLSNPPPPPPPGSSPPPTGPAPATTASVSVSTSSTSTTTVQSSATPQKENAPASSGTSVGLSVIAKNQQREQAIATQAVQTATTTAASAAATAQQEALSVAAQAQANSTTSAALTNTSMSNGTGIKASSTSQTGLSLPGMNADILPNQQSQQAMINNSNNIVASVSTQDNKQLINPVIVSNQTIVNGQPETIIQTQPDFLTNRTNPLNEVIEVKQNVPQTNSMQSIGSSVNRNIGDNDVAGGVSITRMALAPVGYNDYLNLALRDSAFYAPKEIYKNQRNVDNARLLRQLTNDSKHKEMVEQQYVR